MGGGVVSKSALEKEQDELVAFRAHMGSIGLDDYRKYMAHQTKLARLCQEPIPMRIVCPECRTLHVDEGEFATKVHHTHACQSCGNVWRPAVVDTVGVRFLPGFKNEVES